MLMPTVFHENLFDDFFDPFWNDAALERMMNREARDTFGKRGANMMKTDVKQTDNGYEVAVDLPGCKKEDVQMDPVSYTHLDVYKRQVSVYLHEGVGAYTERFVPRWKEANCAVAGPYWIDTTFANKGIGVRLSLIHI